ncbi:MAG: hypothetical protein R3E08_05860 [Thiotrichaceae bacterium]
MPTSFINQWVEMTQASFNTLKQMSESNVASISPLQKGFTSADTAELFKVYANSAQQLSEININALSTVFRNQMNFMSLGVSDAATQELSELSVNFIKQLIQQQTQFTGEFSELFATYLADLQKAKGVAELKTLQIDLFSKIEKKLREHMQSSLEFVNSAKTSTSAWSEKHLIPSK